MLKYASQIEVGDRFYLKLTDFQAQGGRVQNDKGWVHVTVVARERSRMLDEDASVVLVTEFSQRLNTTLPMSLTMDVISEGSPEAMAIVGNVYYEELKPVVKLWEKI